MNDKGSDMLATCKECNIEIDTEVDSHSTIFRSVNLNQEDSSPTIDYILCRICADEERMGEYQKTKELNNTIWTQAILYRDRINSRRKISDMMEGYLKFTEKWSFTLLEIASDMDEITQLARTFENLRWLNGIQSYYASSDQRGHSCFTPDGMKVLLWGSSGRVLLTLQDTHPQGHNDSRFNGAHLTLIFNETSKEARGGIQSICATKKEAIALLNEAMDSVLNFRPRSEVSVI